MTFTLAGIEAFSQIKDFRRGVELSVKILKAWKFEKTQRKKRSHQSQATTLKVGRFKFQKRRGFHNGERGRQAIVYMEGVLIVKLPIQSSKTLEVPTWEKRVIKYVCRAFVEPLLFLMHLHFHLFL